MLINNKIFKILLTSSILFLSLQTPAVTVLVETSLGNFNLELYEDVAPITVENFISYINDGFYTDSFIHRKAQGFVVQGGIFTYTNDILGSVTSKTPIVNEFNLSNTRGTIAMAKFAYNSDSATSSWFINMVDNASLNTENGGYTVFGRVAGDGMNILDAISGLTSYNAGGDFVELPLINYSGTGVIRGQNVVFTKFSVPDSLNDFSNLQVINTVNISNPVPASSVNFTVTITNNGPDNATGVVVSDLLPTGMQLPVAMTPFVSHGSYNLTSGTWTLGSLSNGITATLTLPAMPSQFSSPECYVSEASVKDLVQYDPAIANNKAISTVLVGGATECANLKMTVLPSVLTQASCTTAVPDFLSYRVIVQNSGPDIARNVKLSLSGTLGDTAQATQSDAITFSEIASSASVVGTLTWSLPCTRSEQVAAYSLAMSSDTLLATDSTRTLSANFAVVGATAPAASTSATDTDGGGGGCFIATAAYGSYMDPQVVTLREFRDNVLQKTYLGRKFVVYYYEYSPAIAAIIADNHTLRFIVRVLLTPVVYLIAYPIVAAVVMILLFMGIRLKHRRYTGKPA